MATTPEVPVVLKTYPKHLEPLLGRQATDQQVHKERKIVLYVLSAQNGNNEWLNFPHSKY